MGTAVMTENLTKTDLGQAQLHDLTEPIMAVCLDAVEPFALISWTFQENWNIFLSLPLRSSPANRNHPRHGTSFGIGAVQQRSLHVAESITTLTWVSYEKAFFLCFHCSLLFSSLLACVCVCVGVVPTTLDEATWGSIMLTTTTHNEIYSVAGLSVS